MSSIAQAHHSSPLSRASPNPSFQADLKKYPRTLPIKSSSPFFVFHSDHYRYPQCMYVCPCIILPVLHCSASTFHLPRHLLFHHAPPMIYMLPLLNHSSLSPDSMLSSHQFLLF